MRRLGTHLSVALCSIGLAVTAEAQRDAAAASTKVEAQVVVTGVPGMQFQMSEKGAHLAAVVPKGSRTTVVLDGVEGGRYDEVLSRPDASGGPVAFSADGAHAAYWARVSQEYVVVLDGKEIARGPFTPDAVQDMGFEGARLRFTTFSFDGSRSKYTLVVDGKPDPVANDKIVPAFTRDGAHYAYVATVHPLTSQKRYALIVDGKAAGYPGEAPQWTADGQHLLVQVPQPRAQAIDVLMDGKPFMRAQGVQFFVAPTGPLFMGMVGQQAPGAGPTWFLTVGNRRLPGTDCNGSGGYKDFRFSDDGKHFAAICETAAGSKFMVADGKKGLEYQIVYPARFLADGRAVYAASNAGRWFIVTGEAESDAFMGITPPDIRSAESAAIVAGNRAGFIGRTANSMVVVVDGKVTPARAPRDLTFTTDGARYAFVDGADLYLDGVRQDGVAVQQFGGNAAAPRSFLAFSPDGKHLAHFGNPAARANDPGAFGVFVDGRYVPVKTHLIYHLSWTPDSRHLLWAAREQGDTGDRYVVYMDGKAIGSFGYNLSIAGSAASWDIGENGVVTFLAQDGDSLKRVRVTPGQETSIETLLAAAGRPR